MYHVGSNVHWSIGTSVLKIILVLEAIDAPSDYFCLRQVSTLLLIYNIVNRALNIITNTLLTKHDKTFFILFLEIV